jgi:hypothetical protein
MHTLQDEVLIVSHDILVSKLDLYGITGRENILHKSYLKQMDIKKSINIS